MSQKDCDKESIKILKQRYYDGKIQFLIKSNNHEQWLSQNKVQRLYNGSLQIQKFHQKEDVIESLNLIGSVDMSGIAQALNKCPRKWLFQVQWKRKGKQYLTYEQILEKAPERILDLWEETFGVEPYKQIFEKIEWEVNTQS